MHWSFRFAHRTPNTKALATSGLERGGGSSMIISVAVVGSRQCRWFPGCVCLSAESFVAESIFCRIFFSQKFFVLHKLFFLQKLFFVKKCHLQGGSGLDWDRKWVQNGVLPVRCKKTTQKCRI